MSIQIFNVKVHFCLGGNELKRLASAVDGFGRDALVHRCEFPFIADSEAQEIDVRDLSMGDNGIGCNDFQNAEIFGPKIVTRCVTKLARDRK